MGSRQRSFFGTIHSLLFWHFFNGHLSTNERQRHQSMSKPPNNLFTTIDDWGIGNPIFWVGVFSNKSCRNQYHLTATSLQRPNHNRDTSPCAQKHVNVATHFPGMAIAYGTWYSERVILQFMFVGSLPGVTYLRYTVQMSPKKDETAFHCCDPALSVLVLFSGVSKRVARSINFTVYCLS